MFVKKINSAVHVTDLYNLYITLSLLRCQHFFVISFILSNFVHCFLCIFTIPLLFSPFLTDTPNVTFFFIFICLPPLTNSQINLAASFASSFYRLNNCSHTWFYYLCNICSIISHTFYILRTFLCLRITSFIHSIATRSVPNIPSNSHSSSLSNKSFTAYL